ncbi:MAG: hypothetical protein KKA73_18175 [Chloroflexi bacterium]|nr:hypothetical protein [Chloroflexota bacterium]MBU1749615.1 hypothetical protein [Chloroflexota bacterium]
MTVLWIKSLLTTGLLVLAVAQALTQLQLRGRIPQLLPVSKKALRAWHKWGGDLCLLLVIVIALICIQTQGWRTYDLRGTAHIIVGTLAGLLLLLKVLIARGRRRWLARLGGWLGLVIGLSIAGVWTSSALWYFLFSLGWV